MRCIRQLGNCFLRMRQVCRTRTPVPRICISTAPTPCSQLLLRWRMTETDGARLPHVAEIQRASVPEDRADRSLLNRDAASLRSLPASAAAREISGNTTVYTYTNKIHLQPCYMVVTRLRVGDRTIWYRQTNYALVKLLLVSSDISLL